MASILYELQQKREDFGFAIGGRLINDDGEVIKLTPKEAKFVEDAISSIDYVISILVGKVKLPSAYDDVNSPAGQVFGYLQGSMINITMAETLVYGNWKNVTECFKCMYMSLADEVNNAEDDDYEFDDDDDAISLSGLADEVNNADDDFEFDNDDDAISLSGLADEVNKAEEDEDGYDDCHFVGEREHGDCCDCLDIPDDCRDC